MRDPGLGGFVFDRRLRNRLARHLAFTTATDEGVAILGTLRESGQPPAKYSPIQAIEDLTQNAGAFPVVHSTNRTPGR